MFIVTSLLMLQLAAGVVTGEILHVTTGGGAPDVVLIPGLSGCEFGFRQIVPQLDAAGLQWAIIEPLAIGHSPRPAVADYGLTAQSERVAAVLDEIGDAPVVVLGHGVSASIALRLALRRPDLVRAVLSVEGGPQENAATPTVERSLKWAGLVAKMGGGRLLRDRLRSDLEAASGDRTWLTNYVVRKYFAPAGHDLPAAIKALRAMARAPEPQSLRDNLDRISCPVLVLLGGAPHEGGLTPEEVTILRDRLPQCELRTVAGAGHFIFEEQPTVVVRALIRLAETEVAVAAGPRGTSCAQ